MLDVEHLVGGVVGLVLKLDTADLVMEFVDRCVQASNLDVHLRDLGVDGVDASFHACLPCRELGERRRVAFEGFLDRLQSRGDIRDLLVGLHDLLLEMGLVLGVLEVVW